MPCTTYTITLGALAFALFFSSPTTLALPLPLPNPVPLGGVVSNPTAYALEVAEKHTPTGLVMRAPAGARVYAYPPNIADASAGADDDAAYHAHEARAHSGLNCERDVVLDTPGLSRSRAHSTPLSRAFTDVHGYYARPNRFDLTAEKKTYADYDRGLASDL